MKLSGAQQRAIDAMYAAEDGKITSGGDISRITAEALERMGLVLVTRTLGEREIHHRNGRITRKATVHWTAQIKPSQPGEDMLSELDEVADGVRRAQPRHHDAMAAYVALSGPRVALEGSPLKSPDYNPASAYVAHRRSEPEELVGLYRVFRYMTGERPYPASDHPDIGAVTDHWVVTEPGTPDAPGAELCRVTGETHNAACLAANSLLNRRGGFSARRLGDKELGTWRKDFRAGGRVLRLSAVGDGREQVTEVATGAVLAVAMTPADAEREARAVVDSLSSALTQT